MPNDQLMRVADLYAEALKIKIKDQINANSREMNPLPDYDENYIQCQQQNYALEDALGFIDEVDLSAIVASVAAESGQQEPVDLSKITAQFGNSCECDFNERHRSMLHPPGLALFASYFESCSCCRSPQTAAELKLDCSCKYPLVKRLKTCS